MHKNPQSNHNMCFKIFRFCIIVKNFIDLLIFQVFKEEENIHFYDTSFVFQSNKFVLNYYTLVNEHNDINTIINLLDTYHYMLFHILYVYPICITVMC